MKVAPQRTFNRSAMIKPPLPLEKVKSPRYEKHQVQTFKCRVDPTDDKSSQYEIAVPFFDSGTPEEWIYFQRCLERAFSGQGDTTGPQQYKKTRMLLQGEALTAFEAHVSTTAGHSESVNSLKEALGAVTNSVFPKKAAQVQKRFLRRFLRKPKEMPIKKFAARVTEINSYLKYFPKENGNVPSSLPTDEVVDMLEFGCPPSWQKEMILQDFDTTTATVKELVDFCERLELVEELDGRQKPPKREATEERKRSNKKARRTDRTGKSSGKSKSFDSGFYCMYHGKDKGHDTKDCTVLKHQARAMRGQHSAQKNSEKKNFRAKKEFAAMIGEVTEQLFAKMTPVQKRQVTPDFAVPEPSKQLVAAFENASIESSASSVTDSSGDSSSTSSSDTGGTAGKRMSSSDSEN